jgi:hypothetical protein
MNNQWSSVHVPFRVAGIFRDRMGKWSSGTDSIVAADYGTFMSHISGAPRSPFAAFIVHCWITHLVTVFILSNCLSLRHRCAEHVHPNSTASFKASLNSTNLYEWADQVLWNLPPQRTSYYVDASFDSIRGRIIRWSSEVRSSLGVSHFCFSTVVYGTG